MHINKFPPGRLKERFKITDDQKETFLSTKGFNLLKRMLELNPEKRISASEALSHPWFYEDPKP